MWNMGKLEWDKIGERRYETGVDRVVLYKNNGNSAYAWNGITGITENHLLCFDLYRSVKQGNRKQDGFYNHAWCQRHRFR